ncbi:MAG: hypothetical protein FJX76_01445 [Armatimonadetes bacterium]|nr:hypothetical protein [Armatimonadota bacterium]
MEPEVVEVRAVEAPSRDALMAQANDIGNQLRALIVEAKRLPREKDLEAHQDPARALSIAQAHLQTGFLWLRKAINSPKEF